MLNSHQWIDAICLRLFAAEDRRIDQMVTELNRKNSEIKKKQLFGFVHLGERYIPRNCKPQLASRHLVPLSSLAFELSGEVSAFMTDINKVQQDKEQIRQVLYKLLYQANNIQEVRDSLPEVLVSLVPELSKMNRFIQDPTWLIRNDERALRQYNKMLPKIEMYAMSRMIY